MGYALRRMWLPQRVASLRWNQWQLCRGMRDNFTMESVASFAWNQWQLSYGTGGNFRMERVATFARNTHPGVHGFPVLRLLRPIRHFLRHWGFVGVSLTSFPLPFASFS